MWQKLGKHYPLHLELIPLLLLVSCFVLAIASYPGLPDMIPTHFGPQGTADAWGSRSSVFMFPGFGAFQYVLLTSVGILLAVAKEPGRFINLPKKRLNNLTPAQMENLTAFLNRCLYGIKTLCLGIALYGVHMTIEVALGRAAALGTPFFLLGAGVVVIAIVMVWQSFRLTAGPKQPLR